MKHHVWTLFIIVLACVTTIFAQDPTRSTGKIGKVLTGMDQYGGYICTGTAVTDTGGHPRWRCEDGQWVAASAYAAAHVEIIHRQLDALQKGMETMSKELTANSKKSSEELEKMAQRMSDGIQQIVVKRFEVLPAELLADPVFQQALKQLKEDILKDIKASTEKPSP